MKLKGMKIGEREIKIILVLIGVIVLALCYFVVYRNYTDARESTESEIAALQPTLDEYRNYAANMEEYQQKTAEDKALIEEALSRLPSDVNHEDIIHYVDSLQDESHVGLDETSIAFADPILLADFTGLTKDTINDPHAQIPMQGYRHAFTLEAMMNYDQLKKLITHIYSTEELSAIEAMNIGYNESEGPELNVSAVIDQYSLKYEGAVERNRIGYDAGVAYGTPDVFAGTAGNTAGAFTNPEPENAEE